jgi:Tol biopolymer transport system component
MKRLALALSITCLGVVAIAAARAILSDTGGAESAGRVPNAVRSEACDRELAPKLFDPALNELALKAPPSGPKVDYVIDLKNGAMKPLSPAIIRTAKPDESHPDLSPPGRYAASRDGSRLAYVGRGREGTPQIFIAGIDGSGVRQVTHDPQGANSPAWSPDASMIAYKGAEGSGGLFVLDAATGESTPLPKTGQVSPSHGVQFTPDGSSLLYTSYSSYGSTVPGLRTVPIDGRGKSTVYMGQEEGMADSGNGSLSPDGSLVTMMGSEICGGGALRFVSNADGTHRAQIPGRTSNPAGTWSPDGTRIVCVGWRPRVGVIVVDVATGKVSPVADGTAAIWLDGHRLLVEAS